MQIFSVFGSELRGLSAILLLHTISNVGLVAVAIERLAHAKMPRLSFLAALDGMSRSSYWLQILLPTLARDLMVLMVMVFAFSVTSFSIPFLVSGSQYSLEVLIYEKLKIHYDWGQAFLMSLTQVMLILLTVPVVAKESWSQLMPGRQPTFFSTRSGLLPLGISLGVCFIGLLWGLQAGVVQWSAHAAFFNQEFLSAAWGTVRLLGITTLVLSLGLLLTTYSAGQGFVRQFLIGYLAPSSVIVAFAFWAWGPNGGVLSELKMALALTLLALPTLYRWKLGSVLYGLKRQMELAELMGASSAQIFTKIVLPQVAPTLFWLLGAACFWIVGDFAVASILGFGHETLGTLNESLLGSYRFELASVVSFVMLSVGLLAFLFWGTIGRVVGHKLNS
jgi:ABC-type Fe3+ transport system permease subunit